MSVQSSSNTESAEEDGRLVKLAQEGDASAFDALVRRHADRLLRMVRNLTDQAEEAEDIAQEAFASAYFKLESFVGRSSFFTWLYRIALNNAISRRRIRRMETTHVGRSLDDATPPAGNGLEASENLQRAEQVQLIRDAIARLEPDRQSVLVLRDIDGRDYDEIAAILNIPSGTVRSRLHRARLDLRQLLSAYEAIGGGQ